MGVFGRVLEFPCQSCQPYCNRFFPVTVSSIHKCTLFTKYSYALLCGWTVCTCSIFTSLLHSELWGEEINSQLLCLQQREGLWTNFWVDRLYFGIRNHSILLVIENLLSTCYMTVLAGNKEFKKHSPDCGSLHVQSHKSTNYLLYLCVKPSEQS